MASGNVFIDKWAAAIKEHEGWIPPSGRNPGSPSFRNNNPGNLRNRPNELMKGSIGTDSRAFAIFPTYEAGQAALERDLVYKATNYGDKSILQIMSRYLGGSFEKPAITKEGDPFKYADFVAGRIGTSIGSKIGDLYSSGGGSSSLTGETQKYASGLSDPEFSDPKKPFFDSLTVNAREVIHELKYLVSDQLSYDQLRNKVGGHKTLYKLIK